MNQHKQGDIVVLVDTGIYAYGPSNPTWGKDSLYIKGIIQKVDFDGEMVIEWENGHRNSYLPQACTISLFSDLTPEQLKDAGTGAALRATGRVKELDLAELDKLVISEQSRLEIIALLKQSKHYDKLFTEWGLGKTIEYGRGMGMCFWGGPGVGKTHAVHCIAKALGLDVITLSAAEVQTSEPGGANRNIQEAFKKAKDENSILFLDECDSLITDRTDVGMILGSEINTLLTEIEQFEGIVILATNRVDTLDPALERRIALILEFPAPDQPAREAIWTRIIPKELPLNAKVTAEWLSSYVLTGGQIKNVLLAAARMAVSQEDEQLTRDHFKAAIDRTNASKELMGTRHVPRQRGRGASMDIGKGGKTIEREVVQEVTTEKVAKPRSKK